MLEYNFENKARALESKKKGLEINEPLVGTLVGESMTGKNFVTKIKFLKKT